jgi:hypothetical protein
MSRRLRGTTVKDVREGLQQAIDFPLSDDQWRNKPEYVVSNGVD